MSEVHMRHRAPRRLDHDMSSDDVSLGRFLQDQVFGLVPVATLRQLKHDGDGLYFYRHYLAFRESFARSGGHAYSLHIVEGRSADRYPLEMTVSVAECPVIGLKLLGDDAPYDRIEVPVTNGWNAACIIGRDGTKQLAFPCDLADVQITYVEGLLQVEPRQVRLDTEIVRKLYWLFGEVVNSDNATVDNSNLLRRKRAFAYTLLSDNAFADAAHPATAIPVAVFSNLRGWFKRWQRNNGASEEDLSALYVLIREFIIVYDEARLQANMAPLVPTR